MTWSSIETSEKMQHCVEALENAVATYKALGETAAQKRNMCKLEESKWMLRSKMEPNLTSEALRKAWVTVQVNDLQLDADIADHQATAQREVIRSLQTEADLLRSMNKSFNDMSQDRPGW